MNTLILLLTTIFISTPHADGLAEYFYYTDDSGHIALKLEIDQNELNQYRNRMECEKNNLLDFCVSNYLESNTSFTINEESVYFEFESSSIYNGHVILNFTSKKEFKHINKIHVKNTCFYEMNSKFKNRIQIAINQFQKSYLLTKDKDSILIN